MAFTELNAQIQELTLATHQSYYLNTSSGFICQEERDNNTKLSILSLDHRAHGVPDPLLSFLREKNIRIILYSSTGLLLCLGNSEDMLYICNPVTNKLNRIPDPGVFGVSANKSAMVLGFEPSADNLEANYEIVSAVKFPDEPMLRFEIYSSINETWRESKGILPLDEHQASNLSFTGNKFYLKGIAYLETSNKRVVAFHMDSEEAQFIDLWMETGEDGVFGQINGEICYLCIFPVILPETQQYMIRIYNLAQMELQHEISFIPDEELMTSPWILPGFDGKIVMIHAGLSIYSCSLVGDEANVEFEWLVDVPMELDFSNRRRYFKYANTLSPILTYHDPYEYEDEDEDEDEYEYEERSL